jgi:CO/xanthine dehydrogenase Mo-binding subunit
MSVAEVLGVRYEDVSLTEDNTKYNPRGGGVYGSKGTPTNIGASINAARNARAILLERVAVLMQAKAEDFDVPDGKIFIKGDPARSITIGAVAGAVQFGRVGINAYGQETSFHTNPDTKRTVAALRIPAA